MEYGIRLAGRITQSCSPYSYRDCSMAISIINLASPDSYRDCSILLNGCFNLQSCFNLAQWLFQSSPPLLLPNRINLLMDKIFWKLFVAGPA